jgi:hypothetical protein
MFEQSYSVLYVLRAAVISKITGQLFSPSATSGRARRGWKGPKPGRHGLDLPEELLEGPMPSEAHQKGSASSETPARRVEFGHSLGVIQS